VIPIVLHHGLLGWGRLNLGRLKFCYFPRIDRAIAERGHPLIIPSVHPTGGIERRARQLKASILRQLKAQHGPRQPVIIIAHSMGGLDARYMISRLGMHDQVAALVTITTPHRGSPYADWVVRNLGQRMGAARLVNMLGLDFQAVADLTTESCARMNERTPDAPQVRYYSVSAARARSRIPPFALHAHNIVTSAEGENDSLVSVQSSTWATHLGVWPVDHWHAVNHRFYPELSSPVGDIAPYYQRVLDRLVDDGVIAADDGNTTA
jgi:triacylglycerol lipase